MLFVIAAIIAVLWLAGWLGFKVAGSFIHLLLIVALVFLVLAIV